MFRTASLTAGLAGAACWVALALSLPAQAATLRVALLPIAVNSNLADTAYLSEGLAAMISARIEQSGQINVVRTTDGIPTRESAIEVGKAAGAEFVLFGSYTQFGAGASLDLRCAPVNGDEKDDPRRVFIQAGTPAEIIPQLGDLAQRVTEYLVGAGVSSGPASGDNGSPPAGKSASDLEVRVQALEAVVFAPSKPAPNAEPSPEAE